MFKYKKKSTNYMKKLLIVLFILLTSIISVNAINVDIIKTDPAPVVAGDYSDITIRLTNTGQGNEPLTNLDVDLEETDYIKSVEDSIEGINSVRSGETVTGTIRAYFEEDLPEGFINLNFIVTANDLELTEKISIYVEGSEDDPELLIGEINSLPSELLPDTDNNKLTVTIQNLGDKEAELIRAELVPNSENLKASNSFSLIDSISSLDSGEEANLEFKIDTQQEAKGIIQSTLKLRYRAEKSSGNNYEIYEKNLSLPIEIAPAPLLVVEDVEQVDDFKVGTTENRLRVTVRNDGEEAAEDVRIRITPDISYPFSFETLTEYISAEVAPGESAQVEYKVEVLSSASVRDFPTNVRLESLVSETRYVREDVITISTTEGVERDNTTIGFYFLGFVVLISLILGYLIWRKKKLAKIRNSKK